MILGWSLFAMTLGFFTVLGIAVPGLCMITGLLSLLSIAPPSAPSPPASDVRERGVAWAFSFALAG